MSEKVKALFDEWASKGRDREMAENHKFAVREALKDISVKPDGVILDLGCGNGYVTRALARRLPEATVMGIDFSEEMILNARDETPEAMLNAVFYEGLITDESLDEERFDMIVAMESLYYMRPVRGTLVRLKSLMNDDGVLITINDYYTENEASHDWPEKYDLDMEMMSADEWRDAMGNAGFVNVQQRFVTYPDGEGYEDWKVNQGSLVTIGHTPVELSADALFG